jgi:hypothetical protein
VFPTNKERLVATVLLPLVASACATIVSDDKYMVAFNSTPQDAQATITNEDGIPVHRAKTPFSVTLKASDGYFDAMDYAIRFEAECYEPIETQLKADLDEWYWGNILFGGLIGFLIVDSATGSMWELEDQVSVALPPVNDPMCRERTE